MIESNRGKVSMLPQTVGCSSYKLCHSSACPCRLVPLHLGAGVDRPGSGGKRRSAEGWGGEDEHAAQELG